MPARSPASASIPGASISACSAATTSCSAIPYHYRDRRTVGILDKAFAIVPREEIFAATGLQFMEFNTLYQLLAMKLANSPTLDVAESFLMMPDLFHWLLTGVKVQRIHQRHDHAVPQSHRPAPGPPTCSTASACPTHILGNIVQPGTRLGKIQASRRRRDRPGRRRSHPPRHARHGQRRRGRPRRQHSRAQSPTGATSAAAPGR